MSNPTFAPRVRTCPVCKEVGALEHVALLLYAEDGTHLPTKPVTEYLRSLGMAGSPQKLYNRVLSHRKHIDRWLARGGHVIPAASDDNVIRIPPPTGPQRWIDVQQKAMDLGNDALADLNARMAAGELETRELLALAKLGVGTANTRGRMEQQGRALNGIDRLLQLAAGGLGTPLSEG